VLHLPVWILSLDNYFGIYLFDLCINGLGKFFIWKFQDQLRHFNDLKFFKNVENVLILPIVVVF